MTGESTPTIGTGYVHVDPVPHACRNGAQLPPIALDQIPGQLDAFPDADDPDAS